MSLESAQILLEILSKHDANYERRKPQHKDLSGEGCGNSFKIGLIDVSRVTKGSSSSEDDATIS